MTRFRSPEARETYVFARELGYTYDGVNGMGHLRFIFPATGKAVVCGSSSSPRGVRNDRARLRRVAQGGTP